MRFFSCSMCNPLFFHACGNLMSKSGFLHMKRTFKENVLILVKEGTLHITQFGTEYTVKTNHHILLRAGEEHCGTKASTGHLSYLWVHFGTPETFTETAGFHADCVNVIPEYGAVTEPARTMLLFNQLLDFSQTTSTAKPDCGALMLDYAVSLLLLELMHGYSTAQTQKKQNFPPVITHIIERVRAEYCTPVSITDIATEAGYNSDYISALFRKTTGQTLSSFINETKIQAAKNLLTNYDVSVAEAAYSCGFSDEKYFMRVFRKLEGMTPTEYAQAFFQKNIN